MYENISLIFEIKAYIYIVVPKISSYKIIC